MVQERQIATAALGPLTDPAGQPNTLQWDQSSRVQNRRAGGGGRKSYDIPKSAAE